MPSPASDYLKALSKDAEDGKLGDIKQVIPLVHFRDEQGNEQIGTLNHGRSVGELLGVALLLLAAMKGILIALRALL